MKQYLHILGFVSDESEPVIVAIRTDSADPDLRRFAVNDLEEFGLVPVTEDHIASQLAYYEDGNAEILVLDLDDLPDPIH